MKGIDNMSIAAFDNIISKNYTINVTQAEILGYTLHTTLQVVHGLQGLVAIIANLFTIIAVCKFYFLREDCACRFVASLACADLLAGIVVLFNITAISTTKSQFSIPLCNIKLFLVFMCLLGNAYNILFITIERFIYIIKPLRYSSIVTQHRTSLSIVALWSAVFIHVLVLYIFGSAIDPSSPCVFFGVLGNASRTIMYIELSIIVAVLIVCQTIILLTAKKLNRTEPHISHFAPSLQPQQIERLRQRKMAGTIAVVIGTFLVCYIPATIFNILFSKLYSGQWSFTMLLCSRCLKMVLWMQSLVNPFIYGWRNKSFHRAYRKLLGMKPNHVEPHPVTSNIELNQMAGLQGRRGIHTTESSGTSPRVASNQVAPSPGVSKNIELNQAAPSPGVSNNIELNQLAHPPGVTSIGHLE